METPIPRALGPSAIRVQEAEACDRFSLSEPGTVGPLGGANGPCPASQKQVQL